MKNTIKGHVTFGFALVASVMFLVACSNPTVLPDTTTTRADDQPKPVETPSVNGSTATIPLVGLAFERMYGIEKNEAYNMVDSAFGGTSSAWWSLLEGYCDIIVAYEDNDVDVNDVDVNDVAVNDVDVNDVALEIAAIGRDGLVFLVNESNGVSSLSRSQVADIYTGEITSWEEVGGEDIPILAYQRNHASGSQAMMDKLVMENKTMMAAPEEARISEMGILLEALAEFNGDSSAIGYSVYYYVKNMYVVDNIKLLAIDGVKPSVETIRSGEYPLYNNFFVAIRQDEPIDSPARRMFDWLCSEEGKKCIVDAGYAAN
jgi:phosphate transport system substrate-binding protein